jgi:threonine dehydrogenase-like Zn-dependent dehydrogenase
VRHCEETFSSEAMNAVVITGPGQASLREIDRWSTSAGEVLVRCVAAAICTVERQIFSGQRPTYPAIGGHEVAGVVELVNDPVSALEPGQRVVLDAVRRCGRCHYCVKGQDHLCVEMRESRRPGGFALIGGGFAEFTVVPAARAVRLPECVSFEEASLIEPLACCLHSIRKARLEAGETVVVLGAGTMGGMHIMLAKLQGARVVATDLDPARLAFARHVGADEVLDASRADLVELVKNLTGGRGADAVFVTVGNTQAGERAVAMAGPLGRVVFYASTHPSVPVRLDWNRLHYGEHVITGSAGKTAADFLEAASLLAHKRVELSSFVSRVIALADLPAELGATPAGATQRVLVRHGGPV